MFGGFARPEQMRSGSSDSQRWQRDVSATISRRWPLAAV